MTTQDIVKGLDFTALVELQKSHFNQHVDFARLASDKGIVISSTDTDGSPDVPNPDVEIEGIMPTWWTRYLWKRQTEERALVYVWNEEAESDPIMLKWEQIDADGAQALIVALEAKADAENANDTAHNAVSIANTAQTNANAAVTAATTAKTTAEATAESLAELEDKVFRPGDLKPTFDFATPYSTATDQGWLECNGATVQQSTFNRLYAKIGTLYGSGGEGTFKLPDLRSRFPLGYGQGDGLSNRQLGSKGGAETVTQAGNQVGEHDHRMFTQEEHTTAVVEFPLADPNLHIKGRMTSGSSGNYNPQTTETTPIAGKTSSTPEPEPMPIMNPFLVVRYLIKT